METNYFNIFEVGKRHTLAEAWTSDLLKHHYTQIDTEVQVGHSIIICNGHI